MTLSDSEIKLYQNCFTELQRRYEFYSLYDQQIKNSVDWENVDEDDLVKLLEIVGPSTTRFKITKELLKREGIRNDEHL